MYSSPLTSLFLLIYEPVLVDIEELNHAWDGVQSQYVAQSQRLIK